MFVVVGNPHSGKTRTIQHLFQRKQFYAFKQPIKLDAGWLEKFIVINAPPPYAVTEDHLQRIKSVIQYHHAADTSFLLNLSLIFDSSMLDVKKIFTYFNQSAFEIYYLVLTSSWLDKKIICPAMLTQLELQVKNGSIHMFDRLITQSELRFRERVEEVKEFIRKILDGRSETTL
ncbi:hypothetical protein [Chitinophaga arvensicola]|uniref:hypothetical protein n=1 Tax=Chitinophaga arvensicola TaxID=29529 RepID=UPI00116001ED|nr:hypothetical protein [Chitinophaga arvensicola]